VDGTERQFFWPNGRGGALKSRSVHFPRDLLGGRIDHQKGGRLLNYENEEKPQCRARQSDTAGRNGSNPVCRKHSDPKPPMADFGAGSQNRKKEAETSDSVKNIREGKNWSFPLGGGVRSTLGTLSAHSPLVKDEDQDEKTCRKRCKRPGGAISSSDIE